MSKLPSKIAILIWNNSEEAQKYGIPHLGFAKPEKCQVFKKWDQTTGHEITHVISYYTSGNPQRNRFINEGIATAFNLSRNNRLETIKRIKENENYNEPVSIREAWTNSEKYPELVYYFVSAELIQRLIDIIGKTKFLQLVGDQSYENAKKIYGSHLESIIDYLEKQINL
ncbi:hypothetical protein C0389_08465 [bacterium]|nr:hypothetical protein [bacterium]